MATTNEHCKDCERLLGRSWKKIHLYLDQYASLFPIKIFDDHHRIFLHNRKGIHEVSHLWGKEAEEAAIIHIVRDVMEMPIDHYKKSIFSDESLKLLYRREVKMAKSQETEAMSKAFYNAKSLIDKINQLGYDAYIAGGAVRDLFLEEPTNDVDIATNCPMDILIENFECHEIGQSKDFGVLVVNSNGEYFEVTQFRTEGKYSDGRRPDEIKATNLFYEDVIRRDFTVNALGMTNDGGIIDYVGGLRDLDAKLIRAVGNPEERFKEDHIRLIRAARFASRRGFKIEKNTKLAIRRNSRLIKKVAIERVRMEIFKAAERDGREFAKFIRLLDDLRLLSKILPEVVAMKYFRHDLSHHPEGPTVFDHVIKCIEIMGNIDPISKVAALLHDIGKPASFDESKYSWKMTYHRHEGIGAEMARDICERLKMSLWVTEAIVFATRNHMKFHLMLDMKPSKIAKMVNSPFFSVLKDVAWADEFSRGESFAYYGEFRKKVAKLEQIEKDWRKRGVNKPDKIVSGWRVMDLTGLKPGPEVGKIIRTVSTYILDNDIDINSNPEEVDSLIMKFYEKGK